VSKKEEKAREKGEHQASFQFPYQSFVQANYNTCFLACRKRAVDQRSCGVSPKILVSAIIPARNEEASIARAVESVAAQAEVGEVIVVNDQSTDRTSAILAELGARISKVKVLATGDLPDGWVGKNYAASIGAAAAQGDWLLFTDADTYHYPGSARRALADAVDHDAALVSYSPEQELETFWERALILYVYCRLAAKFSFARVNDPDQPDAAANGQYLMILRDVYHSVGGHASVAGEVLEDVALARRVKEAGYRIYFTAPIGVVRTRMYRSFRAMWEGWTKNLYPLMGGKPGVVVGEISSWLAAAVFILLWGYMALNYRASASMFPAVFLAIVAGAHLRYAVDLYRNLYPISYIKYYVPGMSLYSAALISSWWKNTRGTVVWKGRAYPVRTP
jgi:glycosyltransferase involved in cell wall biosynthesis